MPKAANALKQHLNDGSVNMATKPGLYANIHAKQARIAAGSKEKMRSPGDTRRAYSQGFQRVSQNCEEEIMPLVKSKTPEAFRKNVKAEVAAGKPVKQAVAIAYAVKRAAPKERNNMAQDPTAGIVAAAAVAVGGVKKSARASTDILASGALPVGYGL
jgi:hypothetical protein